MYGKSMEPGPTLLYDVTGEINDKERVVLNAEDGPVIINDPSPRPRSMRRMTDADKEPYHGWCHGEWYGSDEGND